MFFFLAGGEWQLLNTRIARSSHFLIMHGTQFVSITILHIPEFKLVFWVFAIKPFVLTHARCRRRSVCVNLKLSKLMPVQVTEE